MKEVPSTCSIGYPIGWNRGGEVSAAGFVVLKEGRGRVISEFRGSRQGKGTGTRKSGRKGMNILSPGGRVKVWGPTMMLRVITAMAAVLMAQDVMAFEHSMAGIMRRSRLPATELCQLRRCSPGQVRSAVGRSQLRMVDTRPKFESFLEEDDFLPPSFKVEDQSFIDDEDVTDESGEREPGDLRNFPISDQTLDCLAQRGITSLFPVQYSTFNEIFEGRDVLARARTGTGKTLGFSLPILERLIADKLESGRTRRSRGSAPACIILSPTRELAQQVEREIEALTERGQVQVKTLCVYGGVPYHKQEKELQMGVDIVVGTPGRLIDLMNNGALDLSEIRYLVSFSFLNIVDP